MNEQYIALTLGPITRVISLARTTRGLWAASYLFSYLAKKIIEEFKDHVKDHAFLLPYLEDEMFSSKYGGAGIFPDRYIFKVINDNEFDKLTENIEKVLYDLARIIAPEDAENAKAMLSQFLKVYSYKTCRNNTEDNKALVRRCENQLSFLEGKDSFIPKIPDGKNYLSSFINSKSLKPMQVLLDDAGISQFKSIVNISTGDNGLEYNIDVKTLKPYERYIAIVYADGDSMGNAFETIDNSEELSKRLFNFCKKAINNINDFDGQPVYLGGDDLFFFAPVYNPGKGSIFSLLETLDESFHSAIGKETPVSLSFGVSITYVKYPMSEAVTLSQDLLNKAKGKGKHIFPKGKSPLKNNVLFAMQKHSGHTRSGLIHKGCTGTVEKMNKLINKYIVINDDEDLKLVYSVMHNLREHEPVLVNAIADDTLLKNYFDNNYNEPSHGAFKGFFDEISAFLRTAYVEYKGKTESLKNSLDAPIEGRAEGYDTAYAALDLCYATLQFIHLVNSRNNEQI